MRVQLGSIRRGDAGHLELRHFGGRAALHGFQGARLVTDHQVHACRLRGHHVLCPILDVRGVVKRAQRHETRAGGVAGCGILQADQRVHVAPAPAIHAPRAFGGFVHQSKIQADLRHLLLGPRAVLGMRLHGNLRGHVETLAEQRTSPRRNGLRGAGRRNTPGRCGRASLIRCCAAAHTGARCSDKDGPGRHVSHDVRIHAFPCV